MVDSGLIQLELHHLVQIPLSAYYSQKGNCTRATLYNVVATVWKMSRYWTTFRLILFQYYIRYYQG